MTDWRPPADLPDLRRAGVIALDTETRDNRLGAKMGSGWPFADGYICGASVAYREGNDVRSLYFPICHPDTNNFDPARLYQWLRDLLASDVRIVTQNGLYDFGWLHAEADIKMPPAERLEEIGALATLVDENRYAYSLGALCTWRGLPGKDLVLLKEAAAALGLPKRAKVQSHIWQMPARFVGPYAEADAANTLALWESLDPILDQEGTRAAYRLEVDLLPMVMEMRRRGIRIDVAAAEQARDHLLRKRDAVFAELSDKLGAAVSMAEIGRTAWLVEAFDRQSIKYPRTEKGNPSFTAGNLGWMPKHPHWLPQLIVKADKYNNAAVNVLQGYILDHVVRGRIHAEIHPHRSDEGGTRSLRFSYSNPPLQLMPSHDEELALLIRGVFLPEEGEVWAKPDISQQEFRFIVHYAARHKLRGAQQAVDRYRNDPDTDFHSFVAEITGLDRQAAKSVNFAKAFGAGVRKFAQMIGKPESEARVLYGKYDHALPFVQQLSRRCDSAARDTGHLTLYDGARRHWESWVPGVAWTKGAGPCPRDEAERRIKDPTHPWYRYGGLRRADTHKAMNALIQGSAARHTKLWMRACWREGIVPLLQMHDALDCSVSSPAQAELVAQLGCDAVSLEVPMRVDLKFGCNWGDAKHRWEELGGARSEITHQRPSHEVQPEALTTRNIENASPVPTKLNGHASTPVLPEPAIAIPPETIEAESLEERLKRIPLPDLIGEQLIDGKIRCPFHADDTPSLHVYDDHYYCFGCGAHGNHLDWLRNAEGLNDDAAFEALLNWQGRIAPPRRETDAARTLKFALALWKAATPIAGTLAIRYLAEVRGIDTDLLPTDAPLQFHPRCPFGRGQRLPCLIALYRDVETDAPAGIHRIALTPEVFAGAEVQRMSLGTWPRPRVIKLWPATDQLFLGEGLETVLAAATRLQYRGAPMQPAWAAGPGNNLGKIPAVAGVEQLRILVDHDLDGQGDVFANNCRQLWCSAGRDVVRLRPPRGMDFNDVVLEKLRAAP